MTSRPAPKKPPTPAPTPTPAKLKPLPFAFPFPRKGRGQSEASAQFTDEHEVYRLLAEGEQSGAYLVSRKVEYAVESAFVFWARNNLNSASDNGAVADVTKIVNGGQNGYADRRGRYNKVAPPLGISGDQFMNACPASLVSIIAAVSAIAHAEGLCTEKEATIFNCELEKSVSSLCQSAESGALAYRNGMGGKINFQIADNKENKRDVFYFSNASYAGGGEAHIRFSRLDYTYYLYDRTVKTDDGPTFSAGIVIYKMKRKISHHTCNNDASIRADAYQSIKKEVYRSLGAQ